MAGSPKQPREHHYGLHGVYLDAYSAIVQQHSVWPVSHYTLDRWAPLLGGPGFWLLEGLQQLCYRNHAIGEGRERNWCEASRETVAREASLSPATVDRLLHEDPARKAQKGRYRSTGLCHWVTVTPRRAWVEEAGMSLLQPNRYDVLLTPPLVPSDQRGLAQFLLENRVQPGGDVEVALPPLGELAAMTHLDEILALLDECAARFSPPPGWPADRFLARPVDVVRALGLRWPDERCRQEEILELCGRVHHALVNQPQPYLGTNYFRRRFVSRLGHNLALLIVVLRSRCFWNVEVLRDEISMYPSEMADAIGVSARQVQRLLGKHEAGLFLTAVDSGRGKPVTAKVVLLDPIAPEDQPAYQEALWRLLGQETPNHQTPPEIGHFELQTPPEIGHLHLGNFSGCRKSIRSAQGKGEGTGKQPFPPSPYWANE